MNRLEEEVELLEARRETRKAYVKSATVRVEVAKITAEQNAQLAARGAVRPEEALQAKLELAAAAALVVIRERELQEVEVMLKYARKRLEQAKAAPERPGSAGKDR